MLLTQIVIFYTLWMWSGYHILGVQQLAFLNTLFKKISVNKQINDKERVAAALENPNLRELVDQCIEES